MKAHHWFIGTLLTLLSLTGCANKYDIIIIGGGASGTTAAVQAARDGATVLLVEEYQWLGGMLTSAGVSATDGCDELRGGLWSEFRDSLEAHYGGKDALWTGSVSKTLFEPSVGARIFHNIAANEPNLTVMYETTATSFEKCGGGWKVVLGPSGEKVRAKLLIDATELGDVAKAVGIPYDLGMDSRAETGEEDAQEEANDIIQDLTYVMTLQDFGHPVPIPEPDGYDPAEFACCCYNKNCFTPKEPNRMWDMAGMMYYGKLQNGKYMINWPLEGNDFYVNSVDMTKSQRDSVYNLAKQRSTRFLYFMQKELGLVNLGMAEGEFPTHDGFPFIPYHRESRRIKGEVRFTLNHIISPFNQPEPLYRTVIAVGDYPVDQHHSRYDRWDELPNFTYHPVPSYGVPMGVMMPKGFKDMMVIEKSISVTNLVNGSTRLQPVVLQLGQAAGVVAAIAVKKGLQPAEVSVREVQEKLLEEGAYIVPLLDLPPDHEHFKALQRISVTGIMTYEGRRVGWKNQSWFNIDRPVDAEEVVSALKEFYGDRKQKEVDAVAAKILAAQKAGQPMSRLDCAVLIDRELNPFQDLVSLKGFMQS
jgi:hypothetical protein